MNEISGNVNELRMLPLNMGPSILERDVDTYPRTNMNGEMQFLMTTSFASTETAFRDAYGMQEFNISNSVYLVQGVSGNVTLQQTVQREQNIPPQQTVPVGFATLEETEVN